VESTLILQATQLLDRLQAEEALTSCLAGDADIRQLERLIGDGVAAAANQELLQKAWTVHRYKVAERDLRRALRVGRLAAVEEALKEAEVVRLPPEEIAAAKAKYGELQLNEAIQTRSPEQIAAVLRKIEGLGCAADAVARAVKVQEMCFLEIQLAKELPLVELRKAVEAAGALEGFPTEALAAARDKLAVLEKEEQGKQAVKAAEKELRKACEGEDPAALRAALENAKTRGVAADQLELAARRLQHVEAVVAVRQAEASGDMAALQRTIKAALDLGVKPEKIRGPQQALDKLEEAAEAARVAALPPMYSGTLVFRVLEGVALPGRDRSGNYFERQRAAPTVSPYVTVTAVGGDGKGEVRKCEPKESTCDPKWDATLEVPIRTKEQPFLKLEVLSGKKNKLTGKDAKRLGKCRVPFPHQTGVLRHHIPLEEAECGSIHVEVSFTPTREDFEWPLPLDVAKVGPNPDLVPPSLWTGVLTVKAVCAKGLVATDKGKTPSSDPYALVLVDLKGTRLTEWKSKVIKKTLDPEWKEQTTLEIDSATGPPTLVCEVWNKNWSSADDFIGEAPVPFPHSGGFHKYDSWLASNPGKNGTTAALGSVVVEVQWEPCAPGFAAWPAAPPPRPLPQLTGTLVVTMVSAKGLRAADRKLIGQASSDPYAKVTAKVGPYAQLQKTKVVKKNLAPQWNEEFRFQFREPEYPQIQVEVMDHDLAGEHDFLGRFDIPFPHTQGTLDWEFYLEGEQATGSVLVKVRWEPHAEVEKSFQWAPDPGTPRIPMWTGDLILKAIGGAGLRAADTNMFGKGSSDPYLKVTLTTNNETLKWKSKTIKKTLAPTWNEQHTFSISSASVPALLVEVYDQDLKADDFLGESVVAMPDKEGELPHKLVLVTNKKKNKHDAQGTASISLQWVPKKPHRFVWGSK